MFLKFVLIIFLIPNSFMRIDPHEEESEQNTISHSLAKGSAANTSSRLNVNTRDNQQEDPKNTPLSRQLAQGKIIRHIHIHTIDPFGYSLLDTTIYPEKFLKKAGNWVHIKTREKVILNLILVRPNQPFDSLLFKESERLIRLQPYVNEEFATITADSPQSDSVDIYFNILDIWSIIPTLRQYRNNDEAGLADINFMGTGNRLHLDARFGENIKGVITQLGTTLSNIGNSHISGSIQYFFQGDNHLANTPHIRKPAYSSSTYNLSTLNLSNRYLVKSVELSRPFVSPLLRWAGGIFIGQLYTLQNYIDKDSVRYLSSQTNIRDYWAAISLPLIKGRSHAQRTSGFILSARMLMTRYPDAVRVDESLSLFNNETFYFAGIGYTSRRFIQDRYVFNYGKTEDIPVGQAFGITTGIHRQKNNQFYLGIKAAWGNQYPFGYFSSHLEYGTFIASSGWRQQVITGKINYYTRLFGAGYWRIRQFVKPTVIVGINRLATDNISLGGVIRGFDELENPATRLLAISLQTQTYAPWETYGFRFGPYFFSSVGMLSHHAPINSGNRLYLALGLGVLIKNNYLLINTFQVSFTFYPFLPERGYNVFGLNAYKTTDYGLSDFEISKPQVVEYR